MTSAIYLNRTERKFEVQTGRGDLAKLIADISKHVPLSEYIPGEKITHNNTIYFDNEECFLLRQGLLNRTDHLRVRARKYEYDDAGAGDGKYWLELKLREGDTRKKDRITLTAEDLRGLLNRLPIAARTCEYNRPHLSVGETRALYADLQQVIERNSLRPFLLVSYERVAFDNGTVRLSIDSNIRYVAAGESLLGEKSLKDLEPRAGREDTIVMELKYIGEYPRWIPALQKKYPIRTLNSFSKCDRGMRVLLKGPLNARTDAWALLELMQSCKQETATI